MPNPHGTPTLIELAREHRDLLWSRSRGLWIGLGLALLIFGNVVNIVTPGTAYIGIAIEFLLGWGGLIGAAISLVMLGLTLSDLRTQELIDEAVRDERARVAARSSK